MNKVGRNTMATTVELTRQEVLSILVWRATDGRGNWGGWGKYPRLQVGASYLQYDTNPCQINLSKNIYVCGDTYNCITDGTPVGSKWIYSISFGRLQNFYDITDSEIATAVKNKGTEMRNKQVQLCLSHAERMLEQDKYAPFVAPIEEIYLMSERSADSYKAPIGGVMFGNTNVTMVIDEEVVWHQVRKQGRNGHNKKRVFVPMSISQSALSIINSTLEELKAQRIKELKADIAMYKEELATL